MFSHDISLWFPSKTNIVRAKTADSSSTLASCVYCASNNYTVNNTNTTTNTNTNTKCTTVYHTCALSKDVTIENPTTQGAMFKSVSKMINPYAVNAILTRFYCTPTANRIRIKFVPTTCTFFCLVVDANINSTLYRFNLFESKMAQNHLQTVPSWCRDNSLLSVLRWESQSYMTVYKSSVILHHVTVLDDFQMLDNCGNSHRLTKGTVLSSVCFASLLVYYGAEFSAVTMEPENKPSLTSVACDMGHVYRLLNICDLMLCELRDCFIGRCATMAKLNVASAFCN